MRVATSLPRDGRHGPEILPKMASQTQLAYRSNPPTTSDTTPVTILSHGWLNGKVALVTSGAARFGAGTAPDTHPQNAIEAD